MPIRLCEEGSLAQSDFILGVSIVFPQEAFKFAEGVLVDDEVPLPDHLSEVTAIQAGQGPAPGDQANLTSEQLVITNV